MLRLQLMPKRPAVTPWLVDATPLDRDDPAYQDSIRRSHAAMVEERAENNLCPVCGQPMTRLRCAAAGCAWNWTL